ncbi:MAG: LysR family transcriptional regulator [Pseudomonadota bacterium]|nr:LysR family transcriptional regulator [Pseudomonadota bacterium]
METLPDLADLRAFCLVVDTGSITGAARSLGETKGSVSRRITRLERLLGVALLRRSPRLVEATEDGATYRQRLGPVLELLEETTTAVRQTRARPAGHLRVTAPNDLGVSVLAPMVTAFTERHPEVTVEMVLSDRVLDFDADHIDLALRATRTLADSTLVGQRMQDIEAGFFATPAYLAAHPAPTHPDGLRDHRLVLHRAIRGFLTFPLRGPEGAEVSVRVRGAVSSNDYGFVRACVLAGGGIAAIPKVVVATDLAAGTLVPVLPAWSAGSSSLYLLYAGTRFLPAKIRAFRDFVQASFGVPARLGPR